MLLNKCGSNKPQLKDLVNLLFGKKENIFLLFEEDLGWMYTYFCQFIATMAFQSALNLSTKDLSCNEVVVALLLLLLHHQNKRNERMHHYLVKVLLISMHQLVKLKVIMMIMIQNWHLHLSCYMKIRTIGHLRYFLYRNSRTAIEVEEEQYQ